MVDPSTAGNLISAGAAGTLGTAGTAVGFISLDIQILEVLSNLRGKVQDRARAINKVKAIFMHLDEGTIECVREELASSQHQLEVTTCLRTRLTSIETFLAVTRARLQEYSNLSMIDCGRKAAEFGDFFDDVVSEARHIDSIFMQVLTILPPKQQRPEIFSAQYCANLNPDGIVMNIDDPDTMEGQLKTTLLLEGYNASVVGAVGMCGVGKTCNGNRVSP
jgi:hypothetical protein